MRGLFDKNKRNPSPDPDGGFEPVSTLASVRSSPDLEGVAGVTLCPTAQNAGDQSFDAAVYIPNGRPQSWPNCSHQQNKQPT